MKRLLTVSISLLAIFIPVGVVALAQQGETQSESSFQRAREVLDRGVQALGGLEAFQGIQTITFRYSSNIPDLGQSARPDATDYLRPVEGRGVIDLQAKRYYRMTRTHYLGSADFVTTVITSDKSGFTADLVSKVVFPLATAAVENSNKAVLRTFPHQLIQIALSRVGTIRWLGEGDVNGRRQEIITFADSDGSQIALYFDARTHLLTKTETLGDRIMEGLGSNETNFSDYRVVNNIQLPFRMTNSFGGHITQDLHYEDVQLNTRPDDSLFERPKDAEVGPEVGGPVQPLTVTKLAPDVYFVNGVQTGGMFFYSSMFVVFKDYVLMIEAPLGDGLSRSIMAKVTDVAPGKPIKYLALTHYHIDHIGGVRAYVTAGSTVVTTPGNQKFIEHLVLLKHPLTSSPSSATQVPVPIETFTGKRLFTDGEETVELYDVGPTPHVEEMVIAYLPRERLVFVSDLFPVNFMGQVRRGDPTSSFLYHKFSELGLSVETIASGHGRVGSIEELRLAAAPVTTGPATTTQSGSQERRH